MSEAMKPLAEFSAAGVEAIGVGLIVAAALYSLCYAASQLLQGAGAEPTYRGMRQRLGRGILLGLEFLVAADIIHTVAVELTFKTVGVLAVIVVIRTFLSVALEWELEGRRPWQASTTADPAAGRADDDSPRPK